jgi:alcohol dehydrogenase class IV
MAHKLGAYHHLPHGLANALLITEVMRFNAAEAPTRMGSFSQYGYPRTLARYAQIADALGLGGGNGGNGGCDGDGEDGANAGAGLGGGAAGDGAFAGAGGRLGSASDSGSDSAAGSASDSGSDSAAGSASDSGSDSAAGGASDSGSDAAKLDRLIAAIEALKEKIGVKKTIRDYGVAEEDFLSRLDEMSENAFDDQCTGANPRYPLISEIREMYLNAYYGGGRK